jgi:hypothetical protein
MSLQIAATDTDGGSLAYSASGLPAGLSIDPTTGLITGAPTSAGGSTVTVTATDASGPSDSATFTWTIASRPPSGWSEPVAVDPNLESVSCASSSFCAAVDGLGDGITYDGGSWSQPTPIAPIIAVSCPSASFCVAVGDDSGEGLAVTYNGGS